MSACEAIRVSGSRILVAIGDPAIRNSVLHSVRGLADATDDISSPDDGWSDPRVEQERVVLIMGLTTRSGPTSPAWVEAWRARAPLMHIVLCMTSHEMPRMHLARLARAGVDDICFFDDRSGRIELRARIGERLSHAIPLEVGAHLALDPASGSRSGRRLAVNSWCIRNAFRPLRVTCVADHFAVDRKTLYRDARDGGWSDVQAVLGCARLFHVAVALETTTATVERISRRLRFGSAAALHKLVKRYTHRTPAQLRQTGAVGVAAALWRSGGRGRV